MIGVGMVGMVRRRGFATFTLLVVTAELAGRSLTSRVDARLHVRPLANSGADYYPFLLVGAKIACALALAALLARATRAHAAAEAGERLLHAIGHDSRTPRLRPKLSPRVWLAAFVATSLAYLADANFETVAGGGTPSFDPWLHTYALPAFALLAVVVAIAWRFASWLHDVEDFADRAFARVRRILIAAVRIVTGPHRPGDDLAPRRRFGLAFESRPPPLPA